MFPKIYYIFLLSKFAFFNLAGISMTGLSILAMMVIKL